MAIDAFSQAFSQVNWDSFRPAAPARAAAAPVRAATAAPAPVPGPAAPSSTAPVAPWDKPGQGRGVNGGDARTATLLAASEYGDRHATDTYSLENGTEDLSFGDILDIINPLQHIPIVGHIYRNLTGDTIKPSSEIIGGILYGGVLGGAGAVVNAIIREGTGQDIGDHMYAAVVGEDKPAATATATAAAPAATGAKPPPPAAVTVAQTPPASPPLPPPSAPAPALAQTAAATAPAPKAAPPPSPAARPIIPAPSVVTPAPEMPAPVTPATTAAPAERTRGMPAFGTASVATDPPPGYHGALRRQASPGRVSPLAVSRSGIGGPVGAPVTAAPRPQVPVGPGFPSALAAPQPAEALPPSATASLRPAQPAEPLPAPNSVQPMPVTPEEFSQAMARNLEKYQQMSRGVRPAPSTRISG